MRPTYLNNKSFDGKADATFNHAFMLVSPYLHKFNRPQNLHSENQN